MSFIGVKSRDKRRNVSLPASLRGDAAPCAVTIRNVSVRGLTIAVRGPLPRTGSYVDIRRGALTMTGRVRWADGDCIGVRVQDRIDIPALVAGPRASAAQGECARDARRMVAERAERSRHIASTIQFAVVLGVPMGVIGYIGWTLRATLAVPLAAVMAALG